MVAVKMADLDPDAVKIVQAYYAIMFTRLAADLEESTIQQRIWHGQLVWETKKMRFSARTAKLASLTFDTSEVV